MTNTLSFDHISTDFASVREELVGQNGVPAYKLPGTPGGICVDVGSNVGGFASLTCNYFDAIHCIEPSLHCGRQAVRNLQSVGADNIYFYRYAVGANFGDKVSLYKHKDGDSTASTTVPGSGEHSLVGEEVTTISLERIKTDIAKGEYIKYLKVDCEGSEYDFLYGKDLSKIGWLSLELHNTLSPEKRRKLQKHIEKYFVLWYGRRSSKPPTHLELTYISKEFLAGCAESFRGFVETGALKTHEPFFDTDQVIGDNDMVRHEPTPILTLIKELNAENLTIK
jgi:FkbM family methyltransferase